MIKFYVVGPEEGGDGSYHLVTENGRALASHFCSNISWALSDLEARRPERQKEWKERFGEYKVLKIGDDNMTRERLINLNSELYEKEKSEAKPSSSVRMNEVKEVSEND